MFRICFKALEQKTKNKRGKWSILYESRWLTEVHNSIFFTFANVYKVQHIILRKKKFLTNLTKQTTKKKQR